METFEHLGLVKNIARKIYLRTGGTIEMDDLIAYGVVGLQQAAQSFDGSKGNTFSTWAYRRVLGAIIDGVRKMRGYRPAHRAISAAMFNASDVDDLVHCLEHRDSLADNVETRDLISAISDCVNAMGTREKEFMLRIYAGEESYAVAGRAIGVTRTWASRMHRNAIEKIRESL